MALSALDTFEVRTGGSDTNGGGFKTGASGTDRSQQNSAQVVIDNSTITCTTAGANSNVITFVSGYTPTSADVGDLYYSTGGTNINTGWFEITGQTSSTWTVTGAANLTTAGGAGAALTGNMGGALASPGAYGAAAVQGNDCWIASGTYTVTSASSNVAAGCLTLAGSASAANCQRFEGYGSSRSDKGTFPVIVADGVITTFTLLTSSSGAVVENLKFDGNSRTSSRGVNGANAANSTFRCIGQNCTNSAFFSSGPVAEFDLVYATGCATVAAISAAYVTRSTSIANTFTGLNIASNGFAGGCVSANNSGGSSDGIAVSLGSRIVNCVTHGNGRDGVRFTSGNGISTASNTIATSNTGTGFNPNAAFDGVRLFNCAYRANGTNISANITTTNNVGGVLLTVDPYNNAAGLDFSSNSTAGGGAACRASGIPASSGTYSLLGISTPSYPDIGAVQHADPAASGVMGARIFSGF